MLLDLFLRDRSHVGRYILNRRNQQKINLLFSRDSFGIRGKMRSQKKTSLPWSFSVYIEHVCIYSPNYHAVCIEMFLMLSPLPPLTCNLSNSSHAKTSNALAAVAIVTISRSNGNLNNGSDDDISAAQLANQAVLDARRLAAMNRN